MAAEIAEIAVTGVTAMDAVAAAAIATTLPAKCALKAMTMTPPALRRTANEHDLGSGTPSLLSPP